MAEVEHLRGLGATEAKKYSTKTGIFSTHFASEHLLRDVVKDSTVDIMHVFFCGMTRYLISWLFDILIPRDFTWAQLNEAKDAFQWGRGVRVSTLERSKGDKRASCSLHLNAAEMMHFTMASPTIMDKLVKNKEEPAWKCWLTQVALCRFVTRHSYVRGADGDKLTELNDAFLKAFEAVPQWQDRGFEKPKFHPAIHLAVALDEFGPFRAFWCMSFEGYLKVLKPMFKMCNWKGAPTSVAKHWATKVVMHYRDPARGSWFTNYVSPTSEFSADMEALAEQSPMIAALEKGRMRLPHSARSLKKVVRGPDELRSGDWIISRQPGKPARACHVQSIMEFMHHGASFSVVRLWCLTRPVVDDAESGETRAALDSEQRWQMLNFESVHVQVVSCVPAQMCIQFF